MFPVLPSALGASPAVTASTTTAGHPSTNTSNPARAQSQSGVAAPFTRSRAPTTPLVRYTERVIQAGTVINPDYAVHEFLNDAELAEVVGFLLHLRTITSIDGPNTALRDLTLTALHYRHGGKEMVRGVMQCFDATPSDILREAMQRDRPWLAAAALMADETGETIDQFAMLINQFPEVARPAVTRNEELQAALPFDLLARARLGYTPGVHTPTARFNHDIMQLMLHLPARTETIMREVERMGRDNEPVLWKHARLMARETANAELAERASRRLQALPATPAAAPAAAPIDAEEAATMSDAQFIAHTLESSPLDKADRETRCFTAVQLLHRFPERAESLLLHLTERQEAGDVLTLHALEFGGAPRSKEFWATAIRAMPGLTAKSLEAQPLAIDRNLVSSAIELWSLPVLERACQLRPQVLNERDPLTGDTPTHEAARQRWDRRLFAMCAAYGADIDAVNKAGETPLSIRETNSSPPGSPSAS